MSLTYDTALTAIQAAVAEINLTQSPEAQISDAADAVLYGEGSTLDSLGLVNVVMAAEQHIGDAADGLDIMLASEAAMSRKRSPYRSLHALAEYAVEVANAEAQAAE